jgi:hypothetical protein
MAIERQLPLGCRAALVRLLGAALAADVREFSQPPKPSGESPSGHARTVVGQLREAASSS